MDDDLTDVPIEQLYQALGQAVVDGIAEPWETASLYVEIEDQEGGTISGRYTTRASADERQGFVVSGDTYLVFEELAKRMQKPGQPTWNKARFHLRNDGTFDLNVTYPDATP